MGGGSWSSNLYDSSASTRRAKGIKDFGYDDDVRTGRAHGIHADLDPTKMIDGRRESRDGDEHPESLPIAIFFDVTGSMGRIPTMLQTKLATVMDVIIAKAGIRDPQILVGAIGDATCDRYPFQVGQFESDNRFDDQLRNIILEGGGGGQVTESYGLAYRFAAYHTATDSFEKRGKKGYLFTMGDELPWPTVKASEVEKVFGIPAQQDETVESLIFRAQDQWEVYHLRALDGSYRDHDDIKKRWSSLLGERLIEVEDSSLVAEIIAGIIHMQESAYDAHRVADDIGLTGDARKVVENALVPLSGKAMTSKGSGSLPASHG